MKQEDYKRVSTGLGQEIRSLMHEATGDTRDLMTRSELNERLAEMFPDADMAPVREALAKKFVQYAEKAKDRSARFELRQGINDLALHVVTEIEKKDRLVAPEEEPEIDAEELVTQMRYDNEAGGDLRRKADEEQAAAQEILRKAGQS